MQTESKTVKVSGGALENVTELAKSTKRNITLATEYLIELGYSAYLKEEELLLALKAKRK